MGARSGHTDLTDRCVWSGPVGNSIGRLGLLALVVVLTANALRADASWVKLQTSGETPFPRGSMCAQYVARGRRVVTFGGIFENLDPSQSTDNVFYNDVYEFRAASRRWRQLQTNPDPVHGAPEPRAFSVCGLWGDSKLVVGYGIRYSADFSQVSTFSDLWALDLSTRSWQLLANGTGPSARGDMVSAVYGDQLLMFGGVSSAFAALSDTWVLDLPTLQWSELSTDPASPRPSARYGSIFALDNQRGLVFVYGGERITPSFQFVFAGPDAFWKFSFETNAWQPIQSVANIPDRNNGNRAVVVNECGSCQRPTADETCIPQFVLFGGDIGDGPSCPDVAFRQNNVNETWVWLDKVRAWVEMCPEASPPNLKRGVSVLDPRRGMLLFGGFSFDNATCGPLVFNHDTWLYEDARGDSCLAGTPCPPGN